MQVRSRLAWLPRLSARQELLGSAELPTLALRCFGQSRRKKEGCERVVRALCAVRRLSAAEGSCPVARALTHVACHLSALHTLQRGVGVGRRAGGVQARTMGTGRANAGQLEDLGSQCAAGRALQSAAPYAPTSSSSLRSQCPTHDPVPSSPARTFGGAPPNPPARSLARSSAAGAPQATRRTAGGRCARRPSAWSVGPITTERLTRSHARLRLL